MKRTALALICGVLFGLPTSLLTQQRHFGMPFTVSLHGKYGYMDANCKMVVPARFDEAFDFTEGLAAVRADGKWGYIDLSGQFAIAAQFAGAFHFADGLASVRLDERTPLWGFIDKTGMVVIKPKFGMPLWFSEGLVEGYGEKDHVLNVPLGYVDKSGKYTVHLDEPGMEIEFLVGFSEGLARVSMRPKHPDGSVGPSTWGYIDHSGKWAIPPAFAAADNFHEGLAAVTGKDGTWGYIDQKGQFVVAPRFETAMEFSEGLAAVRINGRWGYINNRGKLAIPAQFDFDEVGDFRSGMAIVVKARKVGYVDKLGRVVLPPTLDSGSEFTNGTAAAASGSEFGIIDTSGKMLCRLPLKLRFISEPLGVNPQPYPDALRLYWPEGIPG